MHTHLIYKLELPGPDEHHEPQEALNIEAEGSYLIQVRERTGHRKMRIMPLSSVRLGPFHTILCSYTFRFELLKKKLVLWQIKNPEQSNPPTQGLQNKRKATYPAHLQDHIGSYSFVAADPPDFLNYEGCEFILISASNDIEEELGLELGGEHMATKERSDLLSLFDGYNNDSKALITPLIEGEWA